MNHAFVPLTAKLAAPTATAPGVAGHETTGSGPGVESSFHAVAPASPPAVVPGASSAAHACQPEVALTREGDRVTQITVRCPCGQVIDLACEY